MSTETQPTAAELLAEWKTLEDYRIHLRNDRDDRFASLKESKNGERIDAIAARLDEMCEDLRVEDGVNYFSVEMHCISENQASDRIKEMIALLQWLLIKAAQ